MRILLAEDDAEMRSLLELALNDAGYTVVAVPDGAELVTELERNYVDPQEKLYAAIISDVRMPGATGLDVLDALQAFDWLPPVILITAFGSPELHEEAHRLGAAAVLDKPFETDALVRLVRRTASASVDTKEAPS